MKATMIHRGQVIILNPTHLFEIRYYTKKLFEKAWVVVTPSMKIRVLKLSVPWSNMVLVRITSNEAMEKIADRNRKPSHRFSFLCHMEKQTLENYLNRLTIPENMV